MLKKPRLALKPCKGKASDGEVNDRLSLLPDDILLLILSFVTLKEAARTSLLSHRWKHLWRCLHTLIFEDEETLNIIFGSFELLAPKRSGFIRWVNDVVNRHMGSAVDEFRVIFDLDNSCQSYINEWLEFAFEKHVKRLHLIFEQQWPYGRTQDNRYTLSLKCLTHNLSSKARHSLTSLSLQEINVTTEFIEHILHSCPFLEYLYIAMANYLTRITVSGSSLGLKYLEVFKCHHLKTIYISTPKLLSFKCYGYPIKLRIENASLLSEVYVGLYNCSPIEQSVGPFFKYFSQLEYLTLRMSLNQKMNSGINQVPTLAKLKHLKLGVRGSQSLLGWTSLIEASPVLQKLTLEIFYFDSPSFPIAKQDGQPLRCLKTLEILGFVGKKVDLDIATYVFEKALVLREVIVDLRQSVNGECAYRAAQKRVKDLKKKMPPGAELIFMSIKPRKCVFDLAL